MKKLFALLSAKAKTKEQLKNELKIAFKNYQKAEADDTIEEADEDEEITGFILPVGNIEEDSDKEEK